MPSISIARAANAALSARLGSPTALIVGGSSGVGQALAFKLAQYSDTPRIIISARNPTTAQATLDQLKQINSQGRYDFIPVDMTVSKSIKDLSTRVKSQESKLNFLIVSSGALTMQGRKENEDGIDEKMMFNYYGRMMLIHSLVPLLETTAAAAAAASGSEQGRGEGARVLSVLAATMGGKIQFDDLDLKTHYGLKAAADAASAYNDLAAEQLSRLHPTVGFMHAYPGIVNTSIMSGLPAVLRYASKLVTAFATSPEDCGEWLWYGLSRPEHAKGWYLLNQNGDVVPKAKYHTDEARDKVWKHTVELVKLE